MLRSSERETAKNSISRLVELRETINNIELSNGDYSQEEAELIKRQNSFLEFVRAVFARIRRFVKVETIQDSETGALMTKVEMLKSAVNEFLMIIDEYIAEAIEVVINFLRSIKDFITQEYFNALNELEALVRSLFPDVLFDRFSQPFKDAFTEIMGMYGDVLRSVPPWIKELWALAKKNKTRITMEDLGFRKYLQDLSWIRNKLSNNNLFSTLTSVAINAVAERISNNIKDKLWTPPSDPYRVPDPLFGDSVFPNSELQMSKYMYSKKVYPSEHFDPLIPGGFYVFFTKPNTNIRNLTIAKSLGLVSKDSTTAKPNIAIPFAPLYMNLLSCDTTSTDVIAQSPFLNLFHNRVMNLPDVDITLDSLENWENRFGYKLKFAKNSLRSRMANSVSYRFSDTKDAFILNTVKYWIDYIDLCNYGLGFRNQVAMYRRELDYMCSIYNFVVAADGKTIIKWSKLTGAYPGAVPWSSIQAENGGMHQASPFDIIFEYNHKEENNEAIMRDFNIVASSSKQLVTETKDSEVTKLVDAMNLSAYDFKKGGKDFETLEWYREQMGDIPEYDIFTNFSQYSDVRVIKRYIDNKKSNFRYELLFSGNKFGTANSSSGGSSLLDSIASAAKSFGF